MNVVFLGGGRITSAMLAGLRLAKTKHRLLVHDRDPSKLRTVRKQYAVAVEPDLKRAVARADLVVIAVRPNSVEELLRAIRKVIQPMLAVSLAAGVPLRILRKALGAPVRWARAMPSPVCQRTRPGRRNFSANVARERLQSNPRILLEFRPGYRDSRKQIRRLYCHLLMQPRLPCACRLGRRCAGSGPGSKNCIARRRARLGRRDRGMERGEAFAAGLIRGGSDTRRHRSRCGPRHGCRGISARCAQGRRGRPAQSSR